MDFNKLYARIRDIDQSVEPAIVEYEMQNTSPAIPQTPPVSMNVNLTAQGVDQIKELMALINGAQSSRMSEPMDLSMPAAADSSKCASGGLADMMKLAGQAEKESFANAPDEVVSGIDAVIPSGDDMHRSKRMFKKANGGDNAMAIESIRQMLDKRYQEIKEGDL